MPYRDKPVFIALGFLITCLSISHPAYSQNQRFIRSDTSPDARVSARSSPLTQEKTFSKTEKLEPTGNAIFTPAGSGIIDLQEGSMSTGDIDADGDPDLLITGEDINRTPQTRLYVNDGTGRFTEQSEGLTGVTTSEGVLSDVNGDSAPDIILSGQTENGTSTTEVYVNDGAGGFSRKTDTGLGNMGSNGSLSLGDVDGDSDQDVLITGRQGSTLYLNDGTGVFSPSSQSITGVYYSDSKIVDVNGDDFNDLVLAGIQSGGGDATFMYLNDGTGSFSSVSSGLPDVGFADIAISDVDNDTDPDIILCGQNNSGDNITQVFLNDGNASFTNTGQSLPGLSSVSADFGDVDSDGDPDLLLSGSNGSTASSSLYVNDGNGSFTLLDAGLTPTAQAGQAFADVDGDTDLDFFQSGFDDVFPGPSSRLYINRSQQSDPNVSPSFSRTPRLPRAPVPAGLVFTGLVEAGDLNGDVLSISATQAPASNFSFTDAGNGTAEFVFSPDASQAGQSFTIELTVVDGRGGTDTYTASVDVSADFASVNAGLAARFGPALARGDVNGDGAVDLVITGSTDTSSYLTSLYFGDGNGGFTEQTNTGLIDLARGSASLGDVDADGDLDLLLTGRSASNPGNTVLYINNGSGDFTESGISLVDVSASEASTLHDIDADGDLDILITGYDYGDNAPVGTLYENDGTGSFKRAESIVPALLRSTVSRVDADDNGIQDLVFVGDDGGPYTRSFIAGFGGLTTGPSISTPVSFGDAAGADFDGDGDDDLVVTGQANSSGFGSGRQSIQFYRKQFGEWAPVATDLTPYIFASASAGDVDGDGDPDLLLGGQNNGLSQTTLYRTDPGTFTEYVSLPPVSTGQLAFEDIDADGDNDIIVISSGQAQIFENLLDPVTATSTKLVSGDQTTTFDQTGTSVNFQGTDGDGDVRVDRFDVGPATTLGIDDDASVSNYRFVIEAEESLQFSPTTEVRLDVSTLGGIEDPETVSIFKRDEDGSGAFTQLSTTYDAANNEFVAQVDGFSEFVLASTAPGNPLPVELTQFRAVPDGDEILVEWSTATETANAGFTVEHQAPGSDAFAAAADRDGAGTTTVPQRYSVLLSDVDHGLHRFRLRQADVDGTESLSKTVEIMVGPNGAYDLEQPYPNPVRGTARMNLSVRKEQSVDVVLYNILGQRVAQVHKGRVEPNTPLRLSVDASRLPSGVYFVRVEGERFQATRRMTVVR